MSKKADGMIWAYNRARKGSNLANTYKTCSYEKERAEQRILATMQEEDGFDYRITGKSSNFFSCAYRYLDEDGVLMLAFFTYANRYNVPYYDIEQ